MAPSARAAAALPLLICTAAGPLFGWRLAAARTRALITRVDCHPAFGSIGLRKQFVDLHALNSLCDVRQCFHDELSCVLPRTIVPRARGPKAADGKT